MFVMIVVVTVPVASAPLKVVPRAELATSADATIAIGHAPDGLPLVLSIRRSRNVRRPVLNALSCATTQDLKPAVAAALERLEQVVGQQTCHDGISRRDNREGYTSAQSIGRMLGASLFAKALGDVGPLAARWDGGEDRSAMTSAGVVMNKDEVSRMMGSAGATRKLFVPLPDGRSSVVEETTIDGKTTTLAGARPLVFESLRSLPGVRISYRTLDDHWHDTTIDEGKRYRQALTNANAVAWWVPRHSLALTLAEVGARLGELHAQGVVHGDVKPANILIGAEGPIPIDPLAIPAGRVATVCTPSWAAPEQITVRPVGLQTDVFALGLMLATLLDAVVFGEERTFIVPVGGSEKRSMKVLANPDVFIDPTSGLRLDDAARNAYARFIARCCAFDPNDRPEHGARFHAELSELLARHPLPRDRNEGWIDLGFVAGELHRRVDLLGDHQPAWVLHDTRAFHA
jgi:hypothetical protein